MDVNRSGFDRILVAPDTLEQTIAGNHAIAVLYEVTEKLELAPREADRTTVDGDGHRVEICDEVLAAVNVSTHL